MTELAAPLSFTSTKMNLGRAGTVEWMERVILPCAPRLARLSFFVCLPYPLLSTARELLSGSGVGVGAQNTWTGGGNVTGEVSPCLLAELGCGHVMVGHAERRNLFGEDDSLVARKAAAASEAGLVPVVCVGEQQRVSTSAAARHTARQARAALENFAEDAPVLVLYEPGWAIGAERGASPEHAAEVLEELHRVETRARARFLYGGAVVAGTYTALRERGVWDGAALGRAVHDVGLLREVTAEMLAA
ncbi:triosephosphate isomerase [Actinopolyspora biskrensis]|uniref:Triosephosphate isomerase n=1 Tax=Actinopolyspora biskrensis TaxID=1470178 RepID=A0A852YVC6_9ACTN|nr:triose-phosphate isomerase family protein [Actinopolyspora biskrensis]NYH77672.1 triosephosphate isomerase [Actinopolyspora biskrensis]